MRKKQKWFLIAIFLLLIIVSLAIIYSYLPAILTGAILAYLSYPLYKWLIKKWKNETVSSLVVLAVVLIIIIVPLTFAINLLSREAYSFYLIARDTGDNAVLSLSCSSGTGILCNSVNSLGKVISDSELSQFMAESIRKVTLFLVDASSEFIFSLPGKLLDIFIALFVMYYLLKEGSTLVSGFWKFIPFKKEQEKIIQKKFEDVTSAVVYGNLFTSFVQGAIGGIGFYIFGIHSPIIWGVIISITSFIPVLGTAIVWAPAALYLIGTGVYYDRLGAVGRGIGLLLYGIFIVSLVDNFIKPKVISGKASVHPAIILIGLLGGLKLMGVIGVVIGPLVLALLVTFFEIYREDIGV